MCVSVLIRLGYIRYSKYSHKSSLQKNDNHHHFFYFSKLNVECLGRLSPPSLKWKIDRLLKPQQINKVSSLSDNFIYLGGYQLSTTTTERTFEKFLEQSIATEKVNFEMTENYLGELFLDAFTPLASRSSLYSNDRESRKSLKASQDLNLKIKLPRHIFGPMWSFQLIEEPNRFSKY